MIKNYFKIAWRQLIKNKGYSLINIGGLAIGMAACMLILQYVNFELSFENFHTSKDRIYRLRQDRYDNGKLSTEWAAGAYAAGNYFKDAIPEIEAYVKVLETGDIAVEVDNIPLKIDNVFFATNSFFHVFTYPLIYGDVQTVLKEPNTAAISEATAIKIFGKKNVIGQVLPISNGIIYKITGVFKDMPINSQLQANFLVSYVTFIDLNTTAESNPDEWWTSDGCLTYLLLQKGSSPDIVEPKFQAIVEKSVGEILKRSNGSVTYHLQALTSIHLDGNYMIEPAPNGDRKSVYLLLVIAIFVLVIAWINYINLATALAITRAKEVGVRKAIGSRRKQLIVQFLIESSLLNGLAVVLSVIIVLIAIPAFNQITGLQTSYTLFLKGNFWIGLFGIFIIGTILSGAYPAFILSSFKPVDVLKGEMIAYKQGGLMRKSLVVFQFAASLFLLVGTFTVYTQIKFMQNESLGIDIDQTLVVAPPIVVDSTYANKLTTFKNELLRDAAIKKITISTTMPGKAVKWNAGGIKLVSQEDSDQKQYRIIGVDYDYIELFDLKVTHGRSFSKDFGSDEESVIFNKSATVLLGFDKPGEAVGKSIDFWGRQYKIVGIVDDFHQQSLQKAYEPLILRLIPNLQGFIAIRTESGQIARTIQNIQSKWNVFFPGNTFEHSFLDEQFNEQYKTDNQFAKVFSLFTVLAIIVACLGLFGLASFTALQRKKEIGIRKVLGASIISILKLLYKEFAMLLILAFVISIPISWFTSNQWLQGFSFRIDMHWSFYALPFLIVVIVAFFTVSFQAIKAAIINPVKSLKTE